MATRKIRNWYWVDLRFEGVRYRKRSPENSRAGAEAYEALLRQNLARGESLDAPKPKKSKTFEGFAREWFETYVKTNNKPSEQRTKEYVLRIHLVPFFGRKKLEQITAAPLEHFKMKKVKEGLSPKSINNFLTILCRCLACAVEWDLLDSVPKTKRLRVTPKEVEFLSEDECDRLLADDSECLWHTMIAMARFTGMRIGEILATKWSDVDFQRRQITVQRSIYRGELSSPKSNRIRHIPMTDVLLRILEPQQRESGFIFEDNQGNPLTYDGATAALRRNCRRNGIRPVGWHLLRHTFGSHLVAKGVPIRAVQTLLGHSSIVMTERYAHLAPSTLDDAIAVLDGQKENSVTSFGHYLGNGDSSRVHSPSRQVTETA